MAYKRFDAVQQFSTTTGTSPMVLGAVSSPLFRTLATAGMVNGDTTRVRIQHIDNLNEWEIVLATMSGGSLVRNLDGNFVSPTGALINFSAGTKLISTVVSVQDLATLDSPVFTGDPKAPTPAANDDDTSVATTGFVQANQRTTSTTTLSNLAALQALTQRPLHVVTLGYSTAGDGGGGNWTWVAGDSSTADNALIVTPAGGGGRYKRIFKDTVDPRWWGCTNNSTADQAAFALACQSGYVVDGQGLTFGFAASMRPLGTTFKGLQNVKILLTAVPSNMRGIFLTGQSNFDLRNVLLDMGGAASGFDHIGDGNNYGGIWIDTGAYFNLIDVTIINGGVSNGLFIGGCNTFFLDNCVARDFAYNLTPPPIDDVVAGISISACYDFALSNCITKNILSLNPFVNQRIGPFHATSATWSASVGIVRTSVAAASAPGSTIRLYGFTPSAWNGDWVVATPPVNASAYDTYLTMVSNPGTNTVLGELSPVSQNITAASWSGGIATYTIGGASNLKQLVGNQVVIRGMTPSGYNGTLTLAAGTTGNQLKVAMSNPGTATVMGTVAYGLGTKYFTRGFAIGGSYNYTLTTCIADTVDQGYDCSGVGAAGPNKTITFNGTIASNCGIGHKKANISVDVIYNGCISENCGLTGFGFSGRSTIAIPPSGNVKMNGCLVRNCGADGLWAPVSTRAFGLTQGSTPLYQITAATWASNQITFTLGTGYGAVPSPGALPGTRVLVQNITPSGFTGLFTVVSGTGATVVVSQPTNPGGAAVITGTSLMTEGETNPINVKLIGCNVVDEQTSPRTDYAYFADVPSYQNIISNDNYNRLIGCYSKGAAVFQSGFSFPECTVRGNVNTSLTSTVWTPIAWNIDVDDTMDMHDTVTNNHRIYAKVNGYYDLSATLKFPNTSAGSVQMRFAVNTNAAHSHTYGSVFNAAFGPIVTGDFTLWLNEGDFVEVQGWQDSGSPGSVNPALSFFGVSLRL